MPRLKPPPFAPNCVHSAAEPRMPQHAIAPLVGVSLGQVKAVLDSWPRTRLVEEDSDYLHYVVTSALFRFKDDLELHATGGVVHVRSASRVGYSDLGANRRRVEKLRAQLKATGATATLRSALP